MFGTLFAAIGSYAAFRPSVRSSICELLSRQPDTLRDFIDLGLTLENCEPWFERGVFVFMIVLIVITVIRVSKFCLNSWWRAARLTFVIRLRSFTSCWLCPVTIPFLSVIKASICHPTRLTMSGYIFYQSIQWQTKRAAHPTSTYNL